MHAFRHRQLVLEIMDQPIRVDRHHAVAAFPESIASASAGLWPAVAPGRKRPRATARVLDSDWRRRCRCGCAHGAGVPLTLSGCDVSPVAVAHAALASRMGGADLRFFVHDVLSDPLPIGYDAVICSLFLHHLSDDQAVGVLRRMAAAAGRLVLVSDLARGRAGWLLAWAGGRILTRCDVVHTDAPRSVAAAFTTAEARSLADRAGLGGATVERRWPCRWLLSWRRP